MTLAHLALTLLVLLTGENMPDTSRSEDIAALTEAKLNAWPGYYREQDAEGLSAFLHDDFVFITDSGKIILKAEEVEYVATTPWAGAGDFLYTIKDIAFHGTGTAIIYGEGTSTRETEDGRPCAHSYLSSNTFRKTGDTWQPVFSHVSGVKCEPID